MQTPGDPARMLDRYAVGPKLGAGGFGTVYRARHTILGTDVALKVLSPQHARSPDVVQRFLREAKAAASVGSPHIVTVHDAGVAEGVPFLAMELLSGEDLETRIARGGALPIGEAIEIVLQVLEGLDAAHARGIVHRDMKPANVFLTRSAGRPFVKLLDFGISKIVEPEQRRLTQTGALLGTPAYMAPEQILDMRSVDARADLYAVAVILFEALTGRLPYPADSFGELMARVSGQEPAPLQRYLPGAPPALCALVSRGMRADPAARFASASEMARALAEVRSAPMTHGAFAASSTGPLAEPSPLAAFGQPGVDTGPLGGSQPRPPGSVQTYPPSAQSSLAAHPAPHVSHASPAPPIAHAPPRSSSGPWLAIGVLALLLPIACVVGGFLMLRMTDDDPSPPLAAPVAPQPPSAPLPAPAPPPIVPTLPSPDRPPVPSSPSAPLAAMPIPSNADPCTIPVVYEVDCDRRWDEEVPAPCPSARGRELHVVGSYGSGQPVTVEIARTAAPITLVLSSYAETEWRIVLVEGARVERVVASGYSMSSVTGLPPGVPVETHDRRSVWPWTGWSWEGMNGHWSGRELSVIAERELGLPVRGYTGCYEPTRFRIGQRAP